MQVLHEKIIGAPEPQNLSGIVVYPILDLLHLLCAVVFNRRTLGNKSPDDCVCVLVGAALPAGIRMAVIDLCARILCPHGLSIPAVSMNSEPLSTVIDLKRAGKRLPYLRSSLLRAATTFRTGLAFQL